MEPRWLPDQLVRYEFAGDLAGLLTAACSARWARERKAPTEAGAVDWMGVSTDYRQRWSELDPADDDGVARFVSDCGDLIRRMRGEQ